MAISNETLKREFMNSALTALIAREDVISFVRAEIDHNGDGKPDSVLRASGVGYLASAAATIADHCVKAFKEKPENLLVVSVKSPSPPAV